MKGQYLIGISVLASALLGGVQPVIAEAPMPLNPAFNVRRLLVTHRCYGCDLTGADLSGTRLSGVDLRNANLQDADLSSANLVGADLSKANLTNANLTGAVLTNASLASATLDGVNFSQAHLYYVDVTGASMQNLNLTGAQMMGTSISVGGEAGPVEPGLPTQSIPDGPLPNFPPPPPPLFDIPIEAVPDY
ncbi:pentapeptide repeat-containing protein [Romeria aff. gracilis LEGE 07310]|uniref:Pentapeptide repeat-containing protein n=1 Tax=Vasconcelosia minhoensis LEGE 07310 TaxID=915328 RepID=A0A8J7AI71_9CYAN|nr:pentapeptide repeat-containing protein [Romeria gracilis]MBE9079424.1 pentapeptide repeat-containing protein [Romeria aff. gracilis LEGE 07310]